MKKLYEKSELIFALVWIGIYCVLQSFANQLNEIIGIEYSASAIFCILQAVILFVFIQRNHFMKRYGLCKPSAPARSFLYYVPLCILATENLWNGAAVNDSSPATACHIVCMLGVGFVEELIFRGLLFRAMAKSSVKSAIIVSSLTFGLGHIINLMNGSGMDLVSNVCQIISAIAIGFLFVTIFYRGGSLIPCILTHFTVNALSAFSNEAGFTAERQMVHVLIIIVLTTAYSFILTKKLPKHPWSEDQI